jgi:hypothetical protein
VARQDSPCRQNVAGSLAQWTEAGGVRPLGGTRRATTATDFHGPHRRSVVGACVVTREKQQEQVYVSCVLRTGKRRRRRLLARVRWRRFRCRWAEQHCLVGARQRGGVR